MLDLNALTDACYDLEPLSPSATRLLRLSARDELDVEEIVKIVSYDQAFTARLLRVANSVEVGGVLPIVTVKAAVLRLGIGLVLGIALGSSVRVHLTEAAHAYHIQEGELWRHSVAAASAGHLARSVSDIDLPLESVTASLLHDIGKLVLLRHMTPEGFHVLERAEQEAGFSQREAEKAILGVDHAELGGLIARHWKLPERLVWGITHHHNPEEFELGGDDTICWVVHLADLAAESAGAGIGDIDAPRIEDHSAVLHRLGMTEDGFVQLCEQVADSVEAVMRWYA